MNQQDLSLIEQYYRNELDEAERLAFEKRITEDADFREKALLHQRALTAIHLHAKDILKKKLQDTPLIPLESSTIIWRWVVGVPLLLVLSIGVYLWIKPQSTPGTPTVPTPAQPQDTTLPTISTPNLKQPVALRKPNTEKLFADVYKPYSPLDHDGSVKSANTKPAQNIGTNGVDTLKQLAKEGKFSASLSVFEQLSKEQQSQSVALFLKANSLMALDSTDKAAILFEEVASNQQSAYASYAKWYAALCALKKGNLQKAKKWLQELASGADASKTQREEAEKLLRKLRRH